MIRIMQTITEIDDDDGDDDHSYDDCQTYTVALQLCRQTSSFPMTTVIMKEKGSAAEA